MQQVCRSIEPRFFRIKPCAYETTQSACAGTGHDILAGLHNVQTPCRSRFGAKKLLHQRRLLAIVIKIYQVNIGGNMPVSKVMWMLGVVVFALTACVEGGPSASLGSSSVGKTEAERALEQQARSLNEVSRDIIARNTMQGALVGAAAGCGIALLMGGGGNDCVAGAVVGGVAGGVGGNMVGRQAAAKNVEIVQTREVVNNLAQVSTRLNGVEGNLRRVLASQNSEIRSLQRQVASNQISQSDYRTRVRAINSNRSVVISELERSEANVVKATRDLQSAQSQGQRGLAPAIQAANSNRTRIQRTKSAISLIDL
jgi:uncharacterized protein YcfJ